MDWQTRFEEKLDKVAADVVEVKIEQAAQHGTLKEHTKRSTALEAIVLPLQKKAARLEGAFQLIGILASLAAIVELFIHYR